MRPGRMKPSTRVYRSKRTDQPASSKAPICPPSSHGHNRLLRARTPENPIAARTGRRSPSSRSSNDPHQCARSGRRAEDGRRQGPLPAPRTDEGPLIISSAPQRLIPGNEAGHADPEPAMTLCHRGESYRAPRFPARKSPESVPPGWHSRRAGRTGQRSDQSPDDLHQVAASAGTPRRSSSSASSSRRRVA